MSFLGLLCRQTDIAGPQRWSGEHWKLLKGPLGFTWNRPPHVTTISRALAKFSLEQFRDVFERWAVPPDGPLTAVIVAFDGKTSPSASEPTT